MQWKWLVVIAVVLVATMSSKITSWADAIKSFEGWFPGSRSYRNNNPGNLKFVNQAGATGPDETGHAIFDSYNSGWSALIHQLTIATTGVSQVYAPYDTLYDFFKKYAEENSTQYAEFVARRLGVSPYTQIRELA